MPRKLDYHKKSWVERPLTSGRDFHFQYSRRTELLFGAGSAANTNNWFKLNEVFRTSLYPYIVTPPSIRHLLFETQADGTTNATLLEAKYPNMFHYRFARPVHYGSSVRIIRARTIIDSSATANFTPTVTDLQQSDLSWQLPISMYWRGDHDGSDLFYPIYPNYTAAGVRPNRTSVDYYTPNLTASTADTDATAQNCHEMLLNKRFSKCTISPGRECIMRSNHNFPRQTTCGKMVQVNNTTAFGSTHLAATTPITCWLRQFLATSEMPGATRNYETPGDMFMLPVIPENNANYKILFQTFDTSPTAKARLSIEMEEKFTLIVRCNEYYPDVCKWGNVFPN